MMYLMIFLVVLGVLIIVHEWGHFAMARRLGVKVEKFSIGFGPKIFSFPWKGTEFLVSLIPLGGYVKMAGDERDQCKGDPGEFYSQPVGHRALIVLMGPLVNYLMAFVCFWIVFMMGYPTLAPKVGEVSENYPAYQAGLQSGDKILSINNRSVTNWEEVQKFIRNSRSAQLEFLIARGADTLKVVLIPRMEEQENLLGQRKAVRLVGIKPDDEMVFLKYGPGESIVRSADRLWEITATTYEALYRILTGTKAAREAVTGPIGIFHVIKEAAEHGFSAVLYIMAIISASLAIFNLLPLPILDGGHLFFQALEKLRGRPLSVRSEDMVTKLGFSLLMGLVIFVFYSDIVRFKIKDKVINTWQKMGPSQGK